MTTMGYQITITFLELDPVQQPSPMSKQSYSLQLTLTRATDAQIDGVLALSQCTLHHFIGVVVSGRYGACKSSLNSEWHLGHAERMIHCSRAKVCVHIVFLIH